MKDLFGIASVAALLLVLCGGFAVSTTHPVPEPPVQDEFEPIDNMHHFMEYISQPSYLALKDALAAEPADRKAWKVVKSHALILAETSALVAARVPDDMDEELARQWKQTSLAVYGSGRDLYRSSGDYQQAREHYEAMIDNCNHCHQVFDEGRHQLEK
ncbi:MAG: hypothetical protein ACR2NP_04730 [Pirellulaceae bacterium]